MEYIDVYTQQELDATLAAKKFPVLRGDKHFEITDSASIRAYGSASVRAFDSATVTAFDSATVTASGSATVTAFDSATVTASGSATVTAYDSATVTASGSASVTASGSASVRAYGSASVTASGSASVTASGSASVRAYDSASVRAYGSASVRAFGSASVRAYDSATVTAYDSATVTASGSASVTASKYVPVQILSSRVKVGGGVQIRKPSPKTATAWCAEYGIKPVRGVVTLFKAVGVDFRSPKGCDYSPGTTPVAADWDGGKEECGGGLHFSPFPWMALRFNSDAKKFVACPVRVKDIANPHKNAAYPEKCKAKGCCAPTWECDIDGKPITAKK